MTRRFSIAALTAASAFLLLPALPGTGDAHAQMTMNLASAGRGGGVNAIIEGYEHSVLVPQDAASVRARGARTHEPLTVSKRVDAATPLLYRALANSETIPAVTLRIPTSRTPRGPTMTITLTSARIISIHSATGDDGLPMEHISFNYEKIKWTSSEGGTEYEDDWRTNR